MMSVLICRRASVVFRANKLAQAFATVTPLQSRDRFYINDEPASISLPDSYAGQIQGLQGREHEFAANRAKDTVDMQTNDMEEAMKVEETDSPSDVHAEVHDDSCNVSLHSVMQSNVPEPYTRSSPTHLNMPGSGILQRQRYESNSRVDLSNQARELHTSSVQENQESSYWISREHFEPPAAQGIQGDLEDDCMFKLWLENCHRYNLDCDEMLQGVQSGRKTLSQVFQEQDEMIRKVVNDSKRN